MEPTSSDSNIKDPIKFVPFNSCLNPSFWFELNRVKLDDYKLNDDFKDLIGLFNNSSVNDLPPIMNFDYSSFRINEQSSGGANSNNTTTVHGKLKCFNTINEFNILDKNKTLDEFGRQLWSDMLSDKITDNPNLLITFCLIAFANLKTYVFNYWFAFPAITYPLKSHSLIKTQTFAEIFNQTQSEQLMTNLAQFQEKQSAHQTYFAIDYETMNVLTVREGIQAYNQQKRTIFSYYDPNSQSTNPGWPLRNYLALLSLKCKSTGPKNLEVLSFRNRYQSGQRTINNSVFYLIQGVEVSDSETERINTTGWERNPVGKLHPKEVDMSDNMNSEKLAESAVSLNLKLMKWRIAPDINLDVIRNQKCLLLGSGTLGCNVARCLLAWGVENITFVDNSKVSYSNPVRQSLFSFEDSIGAFSKENFKSVRAAQNLKLIYPGVNAKGVVLSIPMPGHTVGDSVRSKVKDDVKQLEQLIKEHDCLFLLMDTRESRWLPTVIAAAEKKLVINSALGFDSFLVMRHGVKSDEPEVEFDSKVKLTTNDIPSSQLGCYYCNDIVAPGNSTVARTLDQQCTVSRPGLSMIASALSVELMATILQHPLGRNAPSNSGSLQNEISYSNETCLGIIPHQVRGYLHSYSNILPACRSFDKCTACSSKVLEMYRKEGFEFLEKVFNDSFYLEDIVGLKELKNALDQLEGDFVTELSDSDN